MNTSFSSASDVNADSLNCVYGGGYANDNADDAPNYGLACVNANDNDFGNANANIGSRNCCKQTRTCALEKLCLSAEDNHCSHALLVALRRRRDNTQQKLQ